ncbi:Forkhead box protein K2 [Geodia barretti]|nr:Forkhead box protein K2 [Geodia barretti]
MDTAYARLEGRDFEFRMLKRRITIGRNSKLGGVDVNMGNSRFISRRHLDILMERNQLYLVCRGKNGVFVDDIFQKRENKRLQLPNSCIIRFPSTQIKLALTSMIEEMPPRLPPPISPITQPLRIDTTLTSPFVSPMPSPTGTISAVNSCPVSPNAVEQYARRMPFELMAKYASKLLASQQQREEKPVESEGSGERTDEEGGASTEQQGEEEGGQKDAVKPPYSYAQLIVQALLAPKDRRQTLSGIYNFIAEKYPFYKLEDKGWKNSIRHNLSLNQYFMKAPREKEGLGFGKGGYWCMHPDYEEKLTSQAYVKRKKKGIPVFPSAGLLSK